jgi:hypothetical protein
MPRRHHHRGRHYRVYFPDNSIVPDAEDPWESQDWDLQSPDQFYIQDRRGFNVDLRLGGLPGLVFLGFLIYAVSVSHTDAVTDACGANLWTYMLVRLILSCIGFFVFACLAGCIGMCVHSPGVAGITGIVLLIAHSCTLLGVGAPIVTGALGSAPCVAALSASCFTNSPMLAIIGCIFIGFDALQLLVVIAAAFFLACSRLHRE